MPKEPDSFYLFYYTTLHNSFQQKNHQAFHLRRSKTQNYRKFMKKGMHSLHSPVITGKYLWCVVIGWTQSMSQLSDRAQFKILSWKWSVLEVTLVWSRQGAERGCELQACGGPDSSIYRAYTTGAAPEPHTHPPVISSTCQSH